MSALVLLHGFGSSFDHNWRQTGWVDILADFGVTVPAIDLPGHGSSSPLTDPEDYGNVDEEVRSALPADRPLAGVGFSAGACFVTEFGRTPRINDRKGRDHWTHAFSLAFAGAGVPGGQVVGTTDREGGFITSPRAYTMEDYGATIYEKLGIDCTKPIHTPAGRPIYPGKDGHAISELM